MNRRQALTLAAAGLAGCISTGRLTRGHIDAHSHIWTTEVDRFPLRKGVTIEDLAPRSFTTEDLIKLGHTKVSRGTCSFRTGAITGLITTTTPTP